MNVHMCVHVYMYACVSEVLGMEMEHDPLLLCISELQTLVFAVFVCVCVCVCASMCVCVCMCTMCLHA